MNLQKICVVINKNTGQINNLTEDFSLAEKTRNLLNEEYRRAQLKDSHLSFLAWKAFVASDEEFYSFKSYKSFCDSLSYEKVIRTLSIFSDEDADESNDYTVDNFYGPWVVERWDVTNA